MQVIATKVGFYGGSRRKVGEVFEMELRDPKKLPSWVALGRAVAAPAKPLGGDTKPAGAAAAAMKKRTDTENLA